MDYLTELTARLASGAVSIPEVTKKLHAAYIRNQQQGDGGFGGREGGSDPYYTAFALRALLVTDELDPTTAEKSARFLESRLEGQETVIDLISLVFAAAIIELGAGIEVLSTAREDWPLRLSQLLERHRRSDGGYAKSIEGQASSTYQTFLTILTYQLIGMPPPNVHDAIAFLQAREAPEGGFLEIHVAKRPGVNPTAAAVAALKSLNALSQESRQRTIEFLLEQQSDEGGFVANTRIPMADLLSTCTALITLDDLNALELASLRPIHQFILSMQRPTGGFAGFAFDPAEDVEYTFYGIAALACCRRGTKVSE